ncbi:OB-fold domain-containing protein [Arhodomonas sp. SL1]|uniref:OB-fold domain-containing protein n=1 Tax=Arhodomonas sp. SL1 TaxID=3425691 RepID=UPI003F884227
MSGLLPPRQRGPLGRRLTAGAARGRLELPVCRSCGWLSYPPREVCGRCLADALEWRAVPGTGTLLAATRLHHSNEPYFATRLPFRVGTVALAEGAQALCHLAGPVAPGEAVTVRAVLDRGGEGVLVAHARDHDDDPEVRADMNAFTFPSQGRRIAVYAAVPELGRTIGEALLAAGASVVHLEAGGVAVEPAEGAELAALGDLRDTAAARAAVGDVDALVLAVAGAGGDASLETLAEAGGRAASEAAVHTPLALADALRDPLADRGGAVVQLASIFGRAHLPALGRESAVQAMALSAGEGLRARCHACGVRVLTVFAGPYGGPADLPLPAAPARLARGVVAALEAGVEESAADPAAEDILARWREEPKVLERELAAMGEEAK